MKLKIKLVRFAGFALALNCLAQNPDGSTNLESPAVVKLMGEAKAPDAPLSLWYRAPAEKWTEALPLGNGRLGAMVFGGVNREHLQLNEDTLWAAGLTTRTTPTRSPRCRKRASWCSMANTTRHSPLSAAG